MTNFEQAVNAIKEGKKSTALELLKQELASDPQNVNAMLLVAQIVDDPKAKEKWYRFALLTEPQNLQAIQGLKALSDEAAAAIPTSDVSQPSPQPACDRKGSAQPQQALNDCPKCGHRWWSPDAQFCSYCGYSFHSPSAINSSTTPIRVEQTAGQKKTKKESRFSGWMIWGIVFIFLVFLACLTSSIWFFTQKPRMASVARLLNTSAAVETLPASSTVDPASIFTQAAQTVVAKLTSVASSTPVPPPAPSPALKKPSPIPKKSSPTPKKPETSPSSSICDNFDHTTLSSGWNWIDPKGDSAYNLTDNPGYLKITVNGRDHDLYQNLNAPRMLQNVDGNFVVTTRVTISPMKNYQGAGLLYWQDENNYVRLERTLVQGIDLLYKIQGSYRAIEIPFSLPTVLLKFKFENQNLRGFYSEDGFNWKSVETLQLPSSNNKQVGVVVINEWQDNSISAVFDYFKFGDCQ